MGYVDVRATIGNPNRTLTEETQFLFDTGAFHSAIPKIMAENLRLEVAGEISVTLADRREVKAPFALAYLKVLDRESIVPVVIIDVPRPLLGVSALEGLGLKVDPVAGNLEHSRPFGAALLRDGFEPGTTGDRSRFGSQTTWASSTKSHESCNDSLVGVLYGTGTVKIKIK